MMAYNKILLVDDEPFNLDILEKRLSKEGYTVETASNGTEAWDKLQANTDGYEAVLLDRMMPDMDGIEVLRKAKAVPELATVPVIMQTAKASTGQVQEGLEAGAYYYLTKPFEKKSLLAIVKSAVEDYRRYADMQKAIKETSRSVGLMNSGSFTYRTIDEAKTLATLLANTVPDSSRVIVGLTEIMINAVEHGNLAISYEEKSRLLAEGGWMQEIERRLKEAEYCDRVVTINYHREQDSVVFDIIDEGKGFEWQLFMQADPSRAYDTHGRGIMMANSMSFDSITYHGTGNRVVCRVDTYAAEVREAAAA